MKYLSILHTAHSYCIPTICKVSIIIRRNRYRLRRLPLLLRVTISERERELQFIQEFTAPTAN